MPACAGHCVGSTGEYPNPAHQRRQGLALGAAVAPRGYPAPRTAWAVRGADPAPDGCLPRGVPGVPLAGNPAPSSNKSMKHFRLQVKRLRPFVAGTPRRGCKAAQARKPRCAPVLLMRWMGMAAALRRGFTGLYALFGCFTARLIALRAVRSLAGFGGRLHGFHPCTPQGLSPLTRFRCGGVLLACHALPAQPVLLIIFQLPEPLQPSRFLAAPGRR